MVWDTISVVSFFYTLIVIMAIWEIVSRAIVFYGGKSRLSSNRELYKLHGKATLTALPFVLLFALVYNIIIQTYFKDCCDGMAKPNSFRIDSAQGFVIALLIISYEIIRIYTRNAIQDAREKEQIKKELVAAQYEGLKNQINPHFLFNSFSVLTSLVEKDSESAVKFISKLSDMYRYILENDEKSLVPLSEELSFLDDYLFLLQMRHKSSVIVHKHLDNVNLNAQIPPMSLQILIENAVKHNSFSKEMPLTITINATDGATIQVTNQKVEKKELIKSTGIGLRNLSKRLKLLVGKGLVIVENEEIFKVGVPLN